MILIRAVLLCSVTSLENLCHSLYKTEAKLKPMTRSLAFSHALITLVDLTLSSHWFYTVLCYLLLDHFDYFGFRFTTLLSIHFV